MRTLKESILDDIEDTLQAGDDMVKNLKALIKKLRREITSLKNYRMYLTDAVGVFDVKGFGIYNATRLTVNIHRNVGVYKITDVAQYEWFLNIIFYDTDSKTVFSGKVRINNDKPLTVKDIIKGLFADATKNENTFMQFLDNIKKFDGQTVTNINYLIK